MRENSGQFDKEFKAIPVVNVCKLNGVESGVPEEEQGIDFLTSDKTTALHIEALKRNTAIPVLVGIPHSGELVPQNIMDRISDPKAFVDGLDAGTAYVCSPGSEGNSLAARDVISRLVADANRKPDQFGQSQGVGGGVTWTKNIQEQPLYKPGQEPTLEEMAQNVKDYHQSYYSGLHSLIGSLHEKMGYNEMLFIDGHSFPGTADVPKIGLVGSEPKPMFILGSQGNTKASEEVMGWFVDALQRNAPSKEEFPDLYKHISETAFADSRRGWGGFHNVEYFGHPDGVQTDTVGDDIAKGSNKDFKIHAIQMEMNMSTFYNDGKYNRTHLEAIRQTVQKSIEEVGAKLKERQRK